MEVIKKGSIEALLVPLRDRLGNVVTLATVTGLVFDTKKKSDNSSVQTGTGTTFDVDFPMTVICEINSSLSGYVAGEQYKLYLRYTAGTEAPILGPLYFRIEDD